MKTLQSQLNIILGKTPSLRNDTDEVSAFFARRMVDKANGIKLDADDMSASLASLLGASDAAAQIAALVTSADLTASGSLTTLATNVGAHTTQGATLRNALAALTAALTVSATSVTLAGKLSVKTVATPVAAAGSDASDAAALASANVVAISSDSAAKGVKLATGAAGDQVNILNTSSTAAKLYPATGGTLNGLAADAAIVIPASKGVIAICTAADTWTVFDRAAASAAA